MAAITSLANTADTKYTEVVNDSDAAATGINPENLKTLIHNIFIKVDEALAKTNTHTNDIKTTEEIQDIVGAMFTSNSEIRIAATYVDGAEGAGKINLEVDDLDTDSNTTYAISVENGDNTDEEKIRITASTGGTDDIVLEAGTGLTIERNGDKITFTNTDTGSSGAFPSGTRMLFHQANAPTGWTKSTTNDNRALRVVNGSTGGNQGGANSFTGVLNSTVTTGNGSVSSHTLTTAQIPAHFHYSFRSGNAGQLRNGSNLSSNNYPGSGTGAGNLYETYNITARNEIPDVGRTSSTGSTSGHNHGFTNPNFNLNIAYTDVIIAQKD